MANQKPKLSLENRVLQFIRDNKLILPGQKILVAVSGGPDSVCLLYTLCKLQSELNISLHIAHLNHQLRGEESAADAQYVADLARQLKIPATLEKGDVTGYQAEHRLSLEEAAREVRYRFLAEAARAAGADRLAVGHTLNDQVETILLHIIRGTGTAGLRGLQPCHTLQFSGHDLTVIRPLLQIKREETEEYCSRLRLAPCLDTSNYSLSLLRNRVRRELLPLLQTYNAGVLESILRLGRIAQDDLACLDSAADRVKKKIVSREGCTIIFDKAQFIKLATALQRQVLRQTIYELLGTLKDVEQRHIEEVLEALGKPAGKRITLPEGLLFSIEYNRYLLTLNPDEGIPFPVLEGEFDINIPGETRLPGWTIEATIAPHHENREDLAPGKMDGFTACFDHDKVGDELKARTRRRGDRFQPLGMSQLKKVGEFMQDARIPRAWRARIPLVYSPRQIIWVAGWRLDDRVKVTENTRQVLFLKMTRA